MNMVLHGINNADLQNDDTLTTPKHIEPNLFYGTGIPACVLVLHGPGPRPANRKGKILFINADREFTAGRAQDYLDPKHVEKIATAYHDYAPGFGGPRP